MADNLDLTWTLVLPFLMFIWVPLWIFMFFFGLIIPDLGFALVSLTLGVIGIFIVLRILTMETEAEREKKIKEARLSREKEEFERKQKEKGLVKFVDHDGLEMWGTLEQVKKWKELDVGLSNNFKDYTPLEFEKFVGELFRKMGYDVKLTPQTGDYGVDIIAKKDGNTVAVQVKKYAEGNMVGAQVVQQTLGAMWKVKADQSIIITTSGFTVYAREQAKEAPIELWDKRVLHEFVRKYISTL